MRIRQSTGRKGRLSASFVVTEGAVEVPVYSRQRIVGRNAYTDFTLSFYDAEGHCRGRSKSAAGVTGVTWRSKKAAPLNNVKGCTRIWSNGMRIWGRLKEWGYTGGYTGVKEVVRELSCRKQEVFVPLSHPPGEAQVDFGHALVNLNGKLGKVAFFVMSLPYSGAVFVMVFERECTQIFGEGHVRALEFFGGVPRRIRQPVDRGVEDPRAGAAPDTRVPAAAEPLLVHPPLLPARTG